MQPNNELPAGQNNEDIPYGEIIGSDLFSRTTPRPDIAYATSRWPNTLLNMMKKRTFGRQQNIFSDI
jgi:hypothetical protein